MARTAEPDTAATGSVTAPPTPALFNLRPYLKLMADKGASDLFFTPHAPIKIKIEGQILPVGKEILTVELVNQIALSVMNEDQKHAFARELELDFAISEPGLGRFRVNVFQQRGNYALVLRYITLEMPKLDELGLPKVLKELSLRKRGLILMVGATGSGKSTTLAAMVNHRNELMSDHIITIEDPIEFLHPNKKSLVNQRELGLDTHSYARALKSAMRAAPDVVLIGEIRDQETMEAAITLAGTGHLAIATLHANNAAETLDRIINMFPQAQHPQVLMDMSQYLIRGDRPAAGDRHRRQARGGRGGPAEHAAHRRADAQGRHRRHQAGHPRDLAGRHAELRHGALPPLQGRPHRPRPGARLRRFLGGPRGPHQLRLSISAGSRPVGAASAATLRPVAAEAAPTGIPLRPVAAEAAPTADPTTVARPGRPPRTRLPRRTPARPRRRASSPARSGC
jgi:twitching motility protein PilU